MLSRLVIKNFAIIDQLDISLSSGLNIITGETGAGKSILVGALSLLLGQRADTKSLYRNELKCSIEGTFNIGSYGLVNFFEENDLDYEAECILRREISAEGKSRAFINDSPVSLGILKELGIRLVDIHSQHETLDMNTEAFQVKVLDMVAGHESSVAEYRNSLRSYNKNEKRLKELIAAREASMQESGYLEFQYQELIKASLNNPDEQSDLEQEFEELSHSEEIQKGLHQAYIVLDNAEQSALDRIKEAVGNMATIERYFTRISPLLARVKSVQIELRDISSELEAFADDISTDPSRLEAVQARLDLIFSLQQKHRKPTISDLISYRAEIRASLDAIEHSGDDIAQLEQDLEQQKRQLDLMARQISDTRAGVIPVIEQEISTLLSNLGMPDSVFKIEKKADPAQLSVYGIDKITFLFSANKGFAPSDLSKVASGGELSRLMLAVKSLSSQYTAMPTVIFDEIDTGVSGEIALKVGRVMEALASSNQVVAITHLPQIASRGTSHFFVYKDIRNGITQTNLRVLQDNERVNEIAKMLSGNEPGEYALKNARELLSKN